PLPGDPDSNQSRHCAYVVEESGFRPVTPRSDPHRPQYRQCEHEHTHETADTTKHPSHQERVVGIQVCLERAVHRELLFEIEPHAQGMIKCDIDEVVPEVDPAAGV